MIPIAWLGAFWLRDNMQFMPTDGILPALHGLPIVVCLQMMSFFFFQLYRGMWRYSSLSDLVRILKSVAVGTGLILLALVCINRLEGRPRSLFVLDPLLLVGLLSSPRLLVRLFSNTAQPMVGTGKRVLVVGSGLAAEGLIRDLLRQSNQYQVVGILDECHQGRDIHGVRVLGVFMDMAQVVAEYSVERIMIALAPPQMPLLRSVVELSHVTSCVVSVLPSVNDVIDGRVSVEHLRLVSIEDLLGRPAVALEWDKITQVLTDQVVMISGGGGSIGSELCRQIMRLPINTLVVLDNSEYHLFQLQQELTVAFPQKQVRYHLVDVTDRIAVERVVATYRPNSVYHAAAYKHVPMLEYQPRAAVENNVIGTENMILAAMQHKIRHFVLVSTDKAVNPTNILGTTKRTAEMLCQFYQQKTTTTEFIMVRFGNVLGSRGSVVETFKQQIEKGGPVTVTHPDVMRYFMSIPEACQLILQAVVTGRGGDILVLDMGEPIKIQTLAEHMIRLSGKTNDITIEYTGLRSGEKLFEELFHEREALQKSTHPKLFIATSRYQDWAVFEKLYQALKTACAVYEEDAIVRVLKQMVPEFKESTCTFAKQSSPLPG
jgi:FlaA1/EpsC-like NDP-sugar epimerase